MKVIPDYERPYWRLFQALRVPNVGYSRLWAYLMKVISDWAYLMKVIPDFERTYWRLFQTMSVPNEGYSRLWAYLMKVIPDYERT